MAVAPPIPDGWRLEEASEVVTLSPDQRAYLEAAPGSVHSVRMEVRDIVFTFVRDLEAISADPSKAVTITTDPRLNAVFVELNDALNGTVHDRVTHPADVVARGCAFRIIALHLGAGSANPTVEKVPSVLSVRRHDGNKAFVVMEDGTSYIISSSA